MQDLSFDLRNKQIKIGDFKYEIEVFTFENLYTVNEEDVFQENNRFYSKKVRTHGGQTEVEGSISVVFDESNGYTTVKLDCELKEKIRRVKLSVLDVPYGEIVSLIDDEEKTITEDGFIFKYPEGWRSIVTPILVLKLKDDRYLYFRSLDDKVREKCFTLRRIGDTLKVELIFEEIAPLMTNKVSVPIWEIGYSDTLDAIYEKHTQFIEKTYNLVPFEQRKDVPEWLKDISLVAAFHCQHWTGYVFNTYEEILEQIKWMTKHIDGKHILVYLPGWEGRYYWQYGDYRPDSRLGGEIGFKKLVSEAKKLGVRIMPMFGINLVNKGLPNFEQWGQPSEFVLPSGGRLHNGSVDWDGSRHYDHASNANLNPAAPGWQNRLVEQITSLAKEYQFDAAFLDIAAVWVNDANFYVLDGIIKLCDRLREISPDFLVSGEGWYDGLSQAMPLFQSGHTDGRMHYHDHPYEDLFSKYNREFGHLCLGDVSRGSTGVHELGYNPIKKVPFRKGIIPTLTIVDGTIKNNETAVLEIIEDAKKYRDTYLNESKAK